MNYQPPSEFLKAVVAEEVPLSGGIFAENNLRRLITLMTDDDRANRDWATMLVAQLDEDTSDIRDALLRAATDEDEAVRAEAILGLAQRDPPSTLPLLKAALSSETAMPPIFEAAVLIADKSIIGDLRQFSAPSDNNYIDQLVADAIAACERGSA
ncbi:HEAT repeat domain-containing protein [Sphingobium sp. CAP-1]|uniref:HEAT repeat domain-containing protein n=1 Tax=Sphingobium sp. CAP-1 TaxID=2676077 RepID=UPI001E5A5909|nr:HEAT repeat domain-containing protein [Sphingobium sp. CAP-1]